MALPPRPMEIGVNVEHLRETVHNPPYLRNDLAYFILAILLAQLVLIVVPIRSIRIDQWRCKVHERIIAYPVHLCVDLPLAVIDEHLFQLDVLFDDVEKQMDRWR